MRQVAFTRRSDFSCEREEDLDTARVVTRIQAGDRESFATLYERYFDRVYGYLRTAVNDRHEAEDLAQQVFMEVAEALPRYERRSQPFRAWLFKIVRNRAIDHLRRGGRLEVTDPSEIDRRREEAQEDQELVWLLGWISDEDLQFLFSRLPADQRQVLLMRFEEGLTSAEIGRALGRTDKSVRMLQHRALKFLRDRLTAMGRSPHHAPRSRSARVLRRSPVAAARRFSLTDRNGPTR
jgi:RNA polymerase sigma-70 factor (ECF subfamily)